jgi:HEAT repeat protein/beta-lactamase regulating signal transducer with metallopeptidase domain
MSHSGIWGMSPLEAAFGWALIHFLWQGAVVATALTVVLELMRNRSANARCLAACGALGLMAVIPLVTTAVIARSGSGGTLAESSKRSDLPAGWDRESGVIDAGSLLRRVESTQGAARTLSWFKEHASTITLSIWLPGVFFFSLRLLVSWFFTLRLRTRGVGPVDEERRRMLDKLCLRLRVGRAVTLLESALVTVPTMIGWLRPVILLPASALVGLTPAQLEAILAHELAHIRRYDYLINLFQTLIETLLFYHPAVWWVSRRIRQEREACCDDLAVTVSGDPIAYARALLEMETLRAATPRLAVAANGGDLMKRIHRLVGVEMNANRRFAGVMAVALVLTAIISVSVGAARLFPTGDQAPRIINSSAKAEATSLGRLRDERALDSLHAPLSVRRAQAQKKAAEAIALINEVEDENAQSVREPSFDPTPLTMSQAESLQELQSNDPMARAAGACRLGKLGAKDAVPALIDLLADDASIKPVKCWGSGDWGPARAQFKGPSPGEQAALALASMGQSAGEALIAALGNGNEAVRRNAAWAIGEMRGGHSNDRAAAVDPLVGLLSDADPWVRAAAAFSLGEIRPDGVAEPLIASLGDAEWFVREMAIYALGEMKSQAALEPLRSLLLREENESVRRKAAWAMREISE